MDTRMDGGMNGWKGGEAGVCEHITSALVERIFDVAALEKEAKQVGSLGAAGFLR